MFTHSFFLKAHISGITHNLWDLHLVKYCGFIWQENVRFVKTIFSSFLINRGCFLLFVGVKIKGSVQYNRWVPLCDINCDRNNILCHQNFVKIFGLLYNGPIIVDKGYCPLKLFTSRAKPSYLKFKARLSLSLIYFGSAWLSSAWLELFIYIL